MLRGPVRQKRRASRRKPGKASVPARSRGDDIAAPVALAGRGEHGVRAGQHRAVDAPREVHAEEREARVGHRVDEAADEAARLGPSV